MASIGRLFARFPRKNPALLRSVASCKRCISTTLSRFETSPATTKESALEQSKEFQENVKKFEDLSDPDENWVCYGLDPYDREADYYSYHLIFFWLYCVCLIPAVFIVAYYPDFKLQHWVQREAYLQLARREKEGVPLIDPNLVPYDKMMSHLPSDEELGNTKILI